jgi:hypothetical protein
MPPRAARRSRGPIALLLSVPVKTESPAAELGHSSEKSHTSDAPILRLDYPDHTNTLRGIRRRLSRQHIRVRCFGSAHICGSRSSEGALEAIFEKVSAAQQPADVEEIQDFVTLTRQQPTKEDFEAAWAEGRQMTYEQAAAFALGGFNTTAQ